MMFFRIIGLWIFLFALICLAIDGTRSLAADELIITSFADEWAALHGKSYTGFESFIKNNLMGFVWDPVLTNIFSLPIWILLGLLGSLMYWLGRRRRRTSVFIN